MEEVAVMAAGTCAARGRHGGAGTHPSGAPPVLLVPRARLLDPPPSRPSSATPPPASITTPPSSMALAPPPLAVLPSSC
jgi:hypothetical protein